MKILNRFAVPALALFMGALAAAPAMAKAAQQNWMGDGLGQYNGAWDAPPAQYNAIQQQGFRDGIEGARRDFGNHRQPNVNNRDEYRHPDLPRGQWGPYRQGFRAGYERGISYLTGAYAGPAAAPEPRAGYPGRDYQGRGNQGRDWSAYSGPTFEARQRGFEDGMEGAIKDFSNGRRPDPDNRDEFRHPSVPDSLRDAYRDGFVRGYRVGASELASGGTRNGYGAREPRGQARIRGFQDGMDGAMHDFENHRQPNPANRDEYRHPHVPYQLQGAYRNGFERGYDVAMRGLMGLPPGRR